MNELVRTFCCSATGAPEDLAGGVDRRLTQPPAPRPPVRECPFCGSTNLGNRCPWCKSPKCRDCRRCPGMC